MDGSDARALMIVTAGRSLSLTGDVDLDSSEQLIRALTSVPKGDIWIDVSGVSYIDEIGLGVLISETRRREKVGTTMFVNNPSDAVRRLLETRWLLDFLHVDEMPLPGPEDALRDPGSGSGTRPTWRSLSSRVRRLIPRRR